MCVECVEKYATSGILLTMSRQTHVALHQIVYYIHSTSVCFANTKTLLFFFHQPTGFPNHRSLSYRKLPKYMKFYRAGQNHDFSSINGFRKWHHYSAILLRAIMKKKNLFTTRNMTKLLLFCWVIGRAVYFKHPFRFDF